MDLEIYVKVLRQSFLDLLISKSSCRVTLYILFGMVIDIDPKFIRHHSHPCLWPGGQGQIYVKILHQSF